MLHCTILIAFGANLPAPNGQTARETCEWAIGALAALPRLQLVGRSRMFRSVPVPVSSQPDYINGVVRLKGEAEPGALLAALHRIEAEAGRERGAVNAARTLDLDLLGIDGLVIDTPALTLPHPRMHQRAFVLAPLADVAPGWVHPRLGLSARALLAGVDQAGVAALDSPAAEILAGSAPAP